MDSLLNRVILELKGNYCFNMVSNMLHFPSAMVCNNGICVSELQKLLIPV